MLLNFRSGVLKGYGERRLSVISFLTSGARVRGDIYYFFLSSFLYNCLPELRSSWDFGFVKGFSIHYNIETM